MSWLEDLRPASFRDVPFFVRSAKNTGGRRTVVTEYPGRDDTSNEDLGRLPRRTQVEAFVIGNDYMAARDALWEALETAGPGELVHPYLGRLQVNIEGDVDQSESTAEGGMARFSFKCVRAGTQPALTVSVATAQVVDAAADAAVEEVSEEFAGGFSVVDAIDDVRDAAVARLAEATSEISAVQSKISAELAAVDDVPTAISDLVDGAAALVQTPGTLASRLSGVIASVISAISTIPDAVLPLIDTFGGASLPSVAGITSYRTRADVLASAIASLASHGDELPVIPTDTPQREVEAENQAQFIRLVKVSSLAAAAKAAVALEFESNNQARQIRQQLVNELTAVAADAGDATYAALMELRTDVARHLAEVSAQLPALRPYTPARSMPALIVAFLVHGDCRRDQEIIARNDIANPCFVPGGAALEILADG